MANPVVRGVVAVLAGIVAAACVLFIVEGAGHALFPPPAGMDITKPEDQARLMASIPTAAKVMVILAWFLGSLAGSAAAMAIARKPAPGWIVAAIMVGLSLWTTQMFPHPAWMVAMAVLAPAVAAWLAGRLLARRLTA